MTFILPFLFLTIYSFGAVGRLCFVIVAFSGYLHLYVFGLQRAILIFKQKKKTATKGIQN